VVTGGMPDSFFMISFMRFAIRCALLSDRRAGPVWFFIGHPCFYIRRSNFHFGVDSDEMEKYRPILKKILLRRVDLKIFVDVWNGKRVYRVSRGRLTDRIKKGRTVAAVEDVLSIDVLDLEVVLQPSVGTVQNQTAV